MWNVGTLANGASATLTITVTVTSTTPTTNTATKTAEDQTDPVAGNNSASATVTGQAADIAITKIVSNPTPDFGSNVTFTVTATNNGPSSATGVVVNDLLPAGLTFVSAAPSGPYNSGTGDWTVGALANGASSTLSIVATVNTTSPTTNTATKTAEVQPDPVAGNNSATAGITPVAADIALTKGGRTTPGRTRAPTSPSPSPRPTTDPAARPESSSTTSCPPGCRSSPLDLDRALRPCQR